ncbi:hypothetical protein ANO11243_029890 [Dothideomycetidae sp. 11243]|uniref:Thioesterase frbE n=1 Tax=Dothideomycetidae sp. (strain 11243) TaxID=1603295 RepID=FRBE_DOTX1|nr:RecName: Full=Thioesterase frbE; AltName: Full=FR901469 biosynthesis cluster protein E [fungal sp. No.11243]GAM84986.1 hypothetical protein ANO11243_029890 [fungal sp. No.11243]
MSLPNPFLIRPAPKKGKKGAPLVLLHDGGGTIFSYLQLGALGRDVYGIHNTRPGPTGVWEGGIAQMAAEYLDLIKTVVPSGPIIIGGWSLGGLVSFEMARQMAASAGSSSSSEQLQVLGLIMIDSRHPSTFTDKELVLPDSIKPAIRESIQHNMTQSRQLIRDYSTPSWPQGSQPPPTMFLRATRDLDGVPLPIQADAASSTRNGRMEGWREYEHDFIREVVEVEGTHFSIFEDQNIGELDKKLLAACKTLDRGVKS